MFIKSPARVIRMLRIKNGPVLSVHPEALRPDFGNQLPALLTAAPA
jgi:hypothetical protein